MALRTVFMRAAAMSASRRSLHHRHVFRWQKVSTSRGTAPLLLQSLQWRSFTQTSRKGFSPWAVTSVSNIADADYHDDELVDDREGSLFSGRVLVLFVKDSPLGLDFSRLLSTSHHFEKEYSPTMDSGDIDLSFLCDEVNPLNPKAVKKGNPDGDGEVWLVNEKWNTAKPLLDPLNLTHSNAYQKHLEQIIFATSNIKWDESLQEPIHKDLDPEHVPYKPKLNNDEESIDFETLAEAFRQCVNVREGFLQGWQNGPGRIAMETLMRKANSVSEANIYRKFEHMRSHMPARVRNIGGGQYSEGCLRTAYAKLNQNLCVYSTDSLNEKQKKRQRIKEIDTWSKHRPFIMKRYTPDVQSDVQSSAGRTISCLTGEVMSELDNLTRWKKQAWNQALIGLAYTEKTAALLMRSHEAFIMRIEVEEDTINTYESHYPFLTSASIDPNKVEVFFHDLVLTTFDLLHNDFNHYTKKAHIYTDQNCVKTMLRD